MGFNRTTVKQLDQRTPNMLQLEDTATQLLMAFAQNPQGFLQSLGMPQQGGTPPAPNAFAQRANQPGISQMLYGAGAPQMQLPTQTQTSLPMQQAPQGAWTPPPAAMKPAGEQAAKAAVNPHRAVLEDPGFRKFLSNMRPQDQARVMRDIMGRASAWDEGKR